MIDRDWVEWDNLPRQTLFTEDDARQRLPKAVAAKAKLTQINSDSAIEAVVEDLTFRNAQRLLENADLILDGTDNFETRYLINDFAYRFRKPWVHGGCIGAQGQVLSIVPGRTACFRCLLPEPPPADEVGTCDSVGVLGPAVSVIASWQAIEAIKIICSVTNSTLGQLQVIDLWEGTHRRIALDRLRAADNCPTCGKGDYEFLEGRRNSAATVLCGRDAVQIQPPTTQHINLIDMAQRLEVHGEVQQNAFLLRVSLESYTVTLFPDGRAIISGTQDAAIARSIYSRIIGN
ncbi:MAG: Molybdopterin-synthase adenylyltransferase [Planctomycetota bacterium]